MVFRRRVKCYNPINDTFAITNLFGNQFYANNENDEEKKRDCPFLDPIRSQNFKIPLVHELRKQEKVMVNDQPAEEGPCGKNLKILPSSGDLNPKDLPVGQ